MLLLSLLLSLLLDQSLPTSNPDTHSYNSALDALAALPDGTEEDPTILLVRPGVYWLDDPDDPVARKPDPTESTPYATTIKASNIIIRGTTGDPRDVVFAVNRGQTQGADGNYTMLRVTGNNITAENITFGNYCNVDLIYPPDTTQNRPRRADAIVQAQIAICYTTDRAQFTNCHFISRLNLCPFVGARRTLYEGCYFECTDDALNGMGVYRHCRFLLFSSKPFYCTSKAGCLLQDCDIRSLVEGTQCFTKVGGPVILQDCRIEGQRLTDVLWSRGDEDYTCYVDNVTLNGTPVAIDRHRPWRTVSRRVDCDSIMAGAPMAMSLIYKDSTLTARTYAWGDYTTAEHREPYTTTNDNWRERIERVTRTDGNLTASTVVRTPGTLRPSPHFTEPPTIVRESNALILRYALTEVDDGADDISLVTWRRDSLPVMESRDIKRVYYPTPADYGHTISATVVPQRLSTTAGAPRHATYTLTGEAHTAAGFSTDFSSVPLRCWTGPLARDVWMMDSHKPADTNAYDWSADSSDDYPAWRYGEGYDGAAGRRGLFTERRGARLTYIPTAPTPAEMSLKIKIDPCKTGGQGFGSATGQYLDLMLMYDPLTETAYGLRLERSPLYDRAVVMTLMHYHDDVATPLSTPTPTTCFRPDCEIDIVANNKMLFAKVSNATNGTSSTLYCPMERATGGGLRIQHTGSVGSNGLLLRALVVQLGF